MIKEETHKTRIMIIDDHPFVRYGITQLINSESDLTVCCEAGDYHDALSKFESAKPDLAIVDLSLKDINGIELIKEMKTRCPSIYVLVLSMHDESYYAGRAIRAGAKGYVMKQDGTEVLIKAIRTVLSGRMYVSQKIASALIERSSGHMPASNGDIIETLSDRELQVFELIGKGIKTKEIADILNLSVKTVETYRGNIKSKLNISNAAGLMKQAVLWSKSIKT
ncbi:MAG: response regulator transcription factor [Nitrospirae bacterium]|nr:response regulator transcription factor [Nitrospirota bacterium]